jgi:ectoine hydroxylase-related dioxygenase (phytanoyl-CoA dioxygenase family)
MKDIIHHFYDKGWVVIDLIDPSPIWKARELLQKELAMLLGFSVPLEEYHNVVQDDARHTDFQFKLTQFFRKQKLGRSVIEAQESFFKQVVGLDLLVQATPYLRMTRPNKPQDNIGYHRDTFYGGSPYELSVLIPFVDVEKESSLSVMTGSHVFSENLFPTVQVKNPDAEVTKGSAKHQLGFPYAPKLMDEEVKQQMEPIPLKAGQALLFFLSTVHGSIVNRGKRTRWSSDIRVVNALAPVDLSGRPDYYETLSLSAVTACARKYHEANRVAAKETTNV